MTVGLFWVMVVMNFIIFIFVILRSPTFGQFLLYPADTGEYVWFAALIFISYIFATTSWLLPLFYCGAIVILTSILFKEHNEELEAEILNLTEERLERSRQRFNALCEVLKRLDLVCAPINGVNYTLNVVVMITLLYAGIFTEADKLDGLSRQVWIGIVVGWVVLVFAYLAIPTVLGAMLNVRVSIS